MRPERKISASLDRSKEVHRIGNSPITREDVFAEQKPRAKEIGTCTSPTYWIGVVLLNMIRPSRLIFQPFPFAFEILPPTCSCSSMSALKESVHPSHGTGDQSRKKYPNDEVDSRPVEAMEVVMFDLSPMRLDNHGRLEDRDFLLIN
jgi:hypothetical protein